MDVITDRPTISIDEVRDATPAFERQISGRLAAALGVLWMTGIAWVFAVAPPPDPEAPVTALDAIVSLALYGSWLAVFAGLVTRRRLGITAGVAGGVLLAGAGFLCLATGHTGMWIAIQIMVGIGLTAVSATAARLT